MGYPQLDSDETVVLEAGNVKYKSILFDARLTTRRIILIDSRKNIIPPHEILLATVWRVETGENAIRDHLLTLTVVNNAGEKEQIVLTFPRLAGAERKRECGDWARRLQALLGHPREPGQGPVREPPGEGDGLHPSPAGAETGGRRGEKKKKVELSRPLTRIVEPSDVPASPVETSSLPSGIFCSRCGNRIPPESTFCNHCGNPVRQQGDAATLHTDVPQVQIPLPPPAGSTGGQQARPIEEIIHSIEPLIEDSVPRTQPTPLVKKRVPRIVTEPVLTEVPAGPGVPEPPQGVPGGERGPQTPPDVVWPVLQKDDSPFTSLPEPPQDAPDSAPPDQPPPPPPRLPANLTIVVLVIVILAFIGGLILAANLSPGQAAPVVLPTTQPKTLPPTTLPTPPPTTLRTTSPPTVAPTETRIIVPASGVWVRVLYQGSYTGTVGTPGNLKDVSDSGDHIYSIPTSDGIVLISLQKDDGSADRLTAEVYRNGVLIRSGSTATPKGIAEVQVDLSTLTTVAPTAATP